MTSPELARDPEAFLEHLDAQLDMLIRKSASLEARAGSGAATHPSGVITVEFDSAGLLQSIDVAPMWEQHLKAAELATAITDTIVMARDGDDERSAPVELSDDQVAAIRERKLAEVAAEQSAPRTDAETRELLDTLPQSLQELNRSFGELIAKAEELRTQIQEEPIELATATVSSDNEMVTLEVAAGTVVGASVREQWAAGKSGNVITECFAQAIDQLPTILDPFHRQ